jgi:ubiquinone/menaquinone biosynthesis C-methylase UbiE
MEEWKKGSYFMEDLSMEEELEVLKGVSLSASEFEKSIWEGLQLENDIRVMDLGCGPGFISQQLADFFTGGEVMGVDVSHEFIEYAEKQRKLEGIANLNFRQSDIYNLDIEDNCFDLIYMRFVLQHLKCPVEALKNAFPKLKKGGMICVVDIDDSKIKLAPYCRYFDSFNQRSIRGQAEKGGDRNIGNKLQGYFKEAGLQNTKERILKLSSNDMGMERFLDISVKFKLPTIPEAEHDIAMQEFEEIYDLIGDNSFGTVDIYVVTGEKQS